ncbi:MAG: hypothetical protein LUQ13_02060 [Methanomicrobiales archaeon]|nr:hypothetical protein [Methanomicrobiales archaeon]
MAVRSGDETGTPSGSGTFKIRVLNWLGIFRNQMIVLALYFSVVGVLLSVFLGGIDLPMFSVGIIAGSLLSVLQGIRFWKTMNEVRDEGAVFLATLYDKTTITIILVAAMVPTVIFLGAVPAITLTMFNSITGGFIFIMFWWCLLVVYIWESRAKRQLLSDGLTLTLAREASL